MVYNIAVVSGSLRKASTNTGLLRAIVQTKNPNLNFIWVDISDFPVFNQDIQAKGYPAPVAKARQTIANADAVLFGVPQYNFSISAPLKNAYDWLSREDKNKFCPMTQKISAITSAAGFASGKNAQDHFRHSTSYRKVNIMVPSQKANLSFNRFSGPTFFDQNGNLVDNQIKAKIPLFLQEFVQHIKKNKK